MVYIITSEFSCEIGDYIKGIGECSSYKKFLVIGKKQVDMSTYKFLYDVKLLEGGVGMHKVGKIFIGLSLDNYRFAFYEKREDKYLLGDKDGV